jgi:hypothetical protein
MMKVHKSELVPQGRFSFDSNPQFRVEPIYPEHMKWSVPLPLLWMGKSEFEQVYRDLTTIRRFRAFLHTVVVPVSDLWTSAAYPMGVPVERRYYTGNVMDIESDPLASAFKRLMYGYCMSDVRETARVREQQLRRTINETYGSLYRGR